MLDTINSSDLFLSEPNATDYKFWNPILDIKPTLAFQWNESILCFLLQTLLSADKQMYSRTYQCFKFETPYTTENATNDVMLTLRKLMKATVGLPTNDYNILNSIRDNRKVMAVFKAGHKYVFLHKEGKAITYCFSAEVLFNREVSLKFWELYSIVLSFIQCVSDGVKTLIDCTEPTISSSLTTERMPKTSCFPTDPMSNPTQTGLNTTNTTSVPKGSPLGPLIWGALIVMVVISVLVLILILYLISKKSSPKKTSKGKVMIPLNTVLYKINIKYFF